MWYEMIPAMILSGGILVIPHIVIKYANEATVGTPYRRLYYSNFDMLMTLRDVRLAEDKYKKPDPYKLVGLEAIPDGK